MVCKNCKIEHATYNEFCSRKCANIYAAKKVKMTVCHLCNIEIIIPGNQSINQIRYCHECKKIVQKQSDDEKQRLKNKKCELCDSLILSKIGDGRFCSLKCARSFSTKNKRQEINEKVSKTLKEKFPKKEKEILNISCSVCNENVITYNKNLKYCNFCGSSKGGRGSALKQQRRSHNEILFSQLCKEKFGDTNVLENEKMFNGWDADTIILSLKYAILWNGNWHHKKITKKHSLEQVQNRDEIKIKEIQKCDYKVYIIDDFGGKNDDFVKSKFDEFVNFLKK